MQLQHPNFIFSNKPKYRISRHVVFWVFCILFFTLLYGSKPIENILPFKTSIPQGVLIWKSYQIALVEAVSFLPMHIILSYVFMYLLIPRLLFKGRYMAFVLCLGVVVVLVASLSNVVSAMVLMNYRQALLTDVLSSFRIASVSEVIDSIHFNSNFYYGLMGGLRGGLTTSGFAGAIKLAKHWYEKNQLNQQLERQKLMAELQLLKAQVHPHFLFNTLNNLYSLTLTHSEQAPEVVLKLSGLLRYMLYDGNVAKVPLQKEVKLLKDYLELEKLRYGDRLDLSVNIQGDLDDKMIAPLLLLPFLENSFKHGASEQLDQAWISLDLTVRGNKLKFKLMNAVPEEHFAQPEKIGGIGLQNVQKRLRLIYPNQHDLKIMREQEMFLVSLTIDLEPATMPVAAEVAEPTPAPQPVVS